MSEEENQPKRGKHTKEEKIPEYMKRSKRMRRILIVVIIVLIILLTAGAILTYMLVDTARNAATQQAQSTVVEAESISQDEATKDAPTSTTKTTTVPNLINILGMTEEQAMETLQHGAQKTASTEVNEEGNPVRWQIRVALTAEPSDTRSGTPTVYMNLDENAIVLQAGYSAATASLGYGSLSFADAVQNEGIVEKTLAEAGLQVEDHSATLPEDKMEYSTYASDGTTLTREYCSFSGVGTADGQEHNWSAALSYDYSMANATGNLADTIRAIYIYVDAVGFGA